MGAFFRTFFAVLLAIGFLVFVPIFLGLILYLFGGTGPQDDSWLTIRFSGSLLEYAPPPTLQTVFDEHPPTLMEVIENLEKAAVDDRIRGVLLRIDALAAGAGKLDEIRAGIARVREAGKPVYAYSSYLMEGGLYLASECDSTFLFPKGRVVLLGRGANMQHLKGTLEKLDVREQLHAIGDYKSAAELFTREKSSPEAIENLKWLVEDLQSSFDETLTANLDLTKDALDELRARGILDPHEALAAGLVDEAIYFDELEERLEEHHGEWRHISSQAYSDVDRKSVGLTGRPKIAVIHAQGFVTSGGDDRYDAVMGLAIGADRVIDDLRTAWEDDDIRAIVLRWDTGGGETTGGERMARAVARARKEKPVVVSVADVAASAGYTMSFPANTIVCPANGITGSIGSITGKFNMRGLWEKLGVTYDSIPFAPNAFLYSELHDFTPDQWEIIKQDHWNGYEEWVDEIAEMRGLSFEDVDAVGRGRVWTGRQALEHRLVDQLGGFDEALAEARRLADLDADQKVTLMHFPEERSPIDLLLSGDLGATAVASVLWEARQTLLTRAQRPGTIAWEPFRWVP